MERRSADAHRAGGDVSLIPPEAAMKNRADLAVLVLIVAVAACMVLAGLTMSKRWAEIVECRNSLRVIGQSIIDYAVPPDHHFPQAAMPNPALPVEKRLSWHVSIVS